jgi:hypothetical protein
MHARSATHHVDLQLGDYLIDQEDVGRIVADPLNILQVLEREASAAFDLKPLRLDT